MRLICVECGHPASHAASEPISEQIDRIVTRYYCPDCKPLWAVALPEDAEEDE